MSLPFNGHPERSASIPPAAPTDLSLRITRAFWSGWTPFQIR